MSARARTITPPAAAAAPTPIPLKDLQITWHRPAHFLGETGEQRVTITGSQLSTVLACIASRNPTINLESFGDVSLELEGLAAILRALSDVNPGEMEPCPIFWTLSQYLGDLAARTHAVEAGPVLLKKATARVEVTR